MKYDAIHVNATFKEGNAQINRLSFSDPKAKEAPLFPEEILSLMGYTPELNNVIYGIGGYLWKDGSKNRDRKDPSPKSIRSPNRLLSSKLRMWDTLSLLPHPDFLTKKEDREVIEFLSTDETVKFMYAPLPAPAGTLQKISASITGKDGVAVFNGMEPGLYFAYSEKGDLFSQYKAVTPANPEIMIKMQNHCSLTVQLCRKGIRREGGFNRYIQGIAVSLKGLE